MTEHDSLSRKTVHQRLVENDLKPWCNDMWCVPKVDTAYVAATEDVLDLYAEAPAPADRRSQSTDLGRAGKYQSRLWRITSGESYSSTNLCQAAAGIVVSVGFGSSAGFVCSIGLISISSSPRGSNS